MIAQLEFTDARLAATEAERDVALLENYLLAAPGWHTAAEIEDDFGMSDREVRALARQSDKIVSGPGTPGYRHIQDCTIEEVTHATAAAMSQGKLMIQRAIRLRRMAHALLK